MNQLRPGEVGIPHNGDLALMGEFLTGFYYEYNGHDEFVLPTPNGDIVCAHGQWLVKMPNGTFRVEGEPTKKKKARKK